MENIAHNLIAAYHHDPIGRRLWKEVAGNRTCFLYTDEGLIADYDASGQELRTYGYKPNFTWTTDPLFLKTQGTYFFYHNDHLGTPNAITAGNGATAWSANYESFGKAHTVVTPSIQNNLRLAGQHYDQEIGLYYNYHRYYDPRTGRYLTPDPLHLGAIRITRQRLPGVFPSSILIEYALNNPQTLDLYLYVLNNPDTSIDPLGLLDLATAYAKVEKPTKPYLVGGALVVTGTVTTAAGAITSYVGYISTPLTGPAGVLTRTVGVAVTVTGLSQIALGLDVYADELRRQFGLPESFDVLRRFELLPGEERNCE